MFVLSTCKFVLFIVQLPELSTFISTYVLDVFHFIISVLLVLWFDCIFLLRYLPQHRPTFALSCIHAHVFPFTALDSRENTALEVHNTQKTNTLFEFIAGGEKQRRNDTQEEQAS